MASIQHKRGTAAALAATNPVLPFGEICVETDTNKFKIGDGVTAWTSLSYTNTAGATGPQGPAGVTGPSGLAGATGLAGIGVTGATGVAGPTGVTGPTGPAGATGPAGSGGMNGMIRTILFGI